MRKIHSSLMLSVIFLLFSFVGLQAQETFYGLKSTKKLTTSPSKDLPRPVACWSNAGTALLEAELLKSGQKDVDLSEMDFVHNAYLQKADVFLKNGGKIRVGGDGIASDVFLAAAEYGMVPEAGFMKSEKDPFGEDAGEMDAILRGTLRMVLDKEKGVFSERWKNTYDGALVSYIGEARISFKYNDQDFTPKSYAEKLGIKTGDYVLISSDSRQEMFKPFVLPVNNNWSDQKAYNVAPEDLVTIMKNAVGNGFTVAWGGDFVEKSVFAAENVAIVPASKMPGVKANETDKLAMEPVAETIVTPTMRQEKFQTLLSKELSYMLVYGLSKDKKGADYLVAKNTCTSGDGELNLSEAYVKLNTVFLLLNKNSLPADLKVKLGL